MCQVERRVFDQENGSSEGESCRCIDKFDHKRAASHRVSQAAAKGKYEFEKRIQAGEKTQSAMYAQGHKLSANVGQLLRT